MHNELHVFIDDNGEKKYRTPYNEEVINKPPSYLSDKKFWLENYFVLTGAIINSSDFAEINTSINNLKKNYFNTTKVEIKSEWLRISIQRKKKYIIPYSISEEKCKHFSDKYIDLIADYSNKIKLISVIFDKRYFGENKRRTPDGDPIIKSCQVLFERLRMLNSAINIHFDQFESSLKVTKGHHKTITQLHHGKIPITSYTDNLLHIKNIDFKSSASENFLQLVDVASYNVYRQFVEFGREWEESSKTNTLSLYPYFEKIKCNFIRKKGNSCGIGIIKLPETRKCNWDIHKDCEKCKS